MVSAQKLKIIVAEDESAIREILMELLVDEGHDCTVAVDGKDAFEKISQDSFNLLITDLRMPKMNGAELLTECRANNILIPVIFITANHDLLPIEIAALNDGNSALLNKPIDFDTLLLAISKVTQKDHETITAS